MDMLIVNSSPHFRGKDTTSGIMRDVLIALVPCIIAGTVFFGPHALFTVAVTTVSAVLFEFLSRIVMKRRQTIGDLSAAVTGVILGLILPPAINPAIAVFGSAVAVIVVKQMFGGIGQNFANPACTARIVLLLSFTSQISSWTSPNVFISGADAVTGATPLVSGSASYLQLFLGETGGCIGETSVIAILIGFVYLLVRRVINPIITLSYVGSAAILAFCLGGDPLYTVMSGGLLFGAVFMATDYATSPINPWGKLAFGIGCGLITVVIRTYGSMPEGASYAILIMNILTPHIDNLFTSRPLGLERRRAK